MGIGLILLFFAGIYLIWPRISNTTLVFVMAAVLSPATLLGIERANIDLLMFFLLAVSVTVVKKQHILSTEVILFSFILKLFPIFGLVVLLRKSQVIFIASCAVAILFTGVYVWFNFADLVAISEATPRATSLSYGLNVFWMKVMEQYQSMGVYAKIFSYCLALLSLLYALTAFLHDDFSPEDQELPYLDSFRVGAAIYLGTFLLGNNWDYRLMFLIFTIPQLLSWAKSAACRASWGSKMTLVGLYISMWYLVIKATEIFVPYGKYAIFLLDELSNWMVFTGLFYLLFLSMPEWVKQYARSTKISNLGK